MKITTHIHQTAFEAIITAKFYCGAPYDRLTTERAAPPGWEVSCSACRSIIAHVHANYRADFVRKRRRKVT